MVMRDRKGAKISTLDPTSLRLKTFSREVQCLMPILQVVVHEI